MNIDNSKSYPLLYPCNLETDLANNQGVRPLIAIEECT